MKQYRIIKEKYPDAVLLFRVGDFYEIFGNDAVIASEVLGIVLTMRATAKDEHTDLAGFPHHSLEHYLPKLVRAGHRVAVCDQIVDAEQSTVAYPNKDARYSVNIEFTGSLDRPPEGCQQGMAYVARFCGDWIGSATEYVDAQELCRNHHLKTLKLEQANGELH